VYSQDWSVHSVGIRPGVVYGVGRDQGLTSKTTAAILAAAAGKPYEVPSRAVCPWLTRAKPPSAFIRAVARERKRRPGLRHERRVRTVEDGLRILRTLAPSAVITSSGQSLAFPMHLPDEPLRAFLGHMGACRSRKASVETYEAFRSLVARGVLAAPESV